MSSIVFTEIKIAAISGILNPNIVDKLNITNAIMYNQRKGKGQYSIPVLKRNFNENSEEYKELDELHKKGYIYFEY